MQLGFTYYQVKQGFLANFKAKRTFNRTVLRLAMKHGIEGFTLVPGIGAWQGKTEPTYQMQLEGVKLRTARALAADLREAFNQDAVMVKSGQRVEFI